MFKIFSIYKGNYINKLPIDKLPYNTTRIIPGGAKYNVYPFAFKVPFWSRTRLNF